VLVEAFWRSLRQLVWPIAITEDTAIEQVAALAQGLLRVCSEHVPIAAEPCNPKIYHNENPANFCNESATNFY
jgi:hypothetical protein